MIDYLPKLPFDVHDNNKYPIYTNVSSCVNADENKFVATPNLLGQYDFFDLSGNFLHSSVIHWDQDLINAAPSANLVFKSPITYYQTEIRNYNSLLYSLYTASEKKGQQLIPPMNSKIYVLDWDGKPIKEYILDSPVYSFAFDSNNNCFYGVKVNSDSFEISIVKYNL